MKIEPIARWDNGRLQKLSLPRAQKMERKGLCGFGAYATAVFF